MPLFYQVLTDCFIFWFFKITETQRSMFTVFVCASCGYCFFKDRLGSLSGKTVAVIVFEGSGTDDPISYKSKIPLNILGRDLPQVKAIGGAGIFAGTNLPQKSQEIFQQAAAWPHQVSHFLYLLHGFHIIFLLFSVTLLHRLPGQKFQRVFLLVSIWPRNCQNFRTCRYCWSSLAFVLFLRFTHVHNIQRIYFDRNKAPRNYQKSSMSLLCLSSVTIYDLEWVATLFRASQMDGVSEEGRGQCFSSMFFCFGVGCSYCMSGLLASANGTDSELLWNQ